MANDNFDIDDDEAEARFATLSPTQRAIVEEILETTPNYRYDLGPPIFPPPAPGLPSALAAVHVMVTRIKAELAE